MVELAVNIRVEEQLLKPLTDGKIVPKEKLRRGEKGGEKCRNALLVQVTDES